MTNKECLVHCYWHAVWFEFSRLGKSYPNTTSSNTHVPPPRPALRCDYSEEAHVKQSRHPTMAARAYYCCRYKIVSIKFFSWIGLFLFSALCCQCDWKKNYFLQNQGWCNFFQWIDGPEMWNSQILLFLYDWNESFPYHSFKRWVPRHRIPLQWQMRRRRKQLLIMSATLFCANVGTILSWRTHRPVWITHHLGQCQCHMSS
jgi:hypothetical protein